MGAESKFDKLREVLTGPEVRAARNSSSSPSTATRSTYLVHRLGGMGYTGQIAQIHGGMDYKDRQDTGRTLPPAP